MRRSKFFSTLLAIILLSGGLRDSPKAAGASAYVAPPQLVPSDLIPPAMTALAVEGNYAFVGTSTYLLVVDVSDPDHPVQVGYTRLPAPAKAVAATSERLYVLTDKKPYFYYTYHEETTDDLVLIFDITHPRDPELED